MARQLHLLPKHFPFVSLCHYVMKLLAVACAIYRATPGHATFCGKVSPGLGLGLRETVTFSWSSENQNNARQFVSK